MEYIKNLKNCSEEAMKQFWGAEEVVVKFLLNATVVDITNRKRSEESQVHIF